LAELLEWSEAPAKAATKVKSANHPGLLATELWKTRGYQKEVRLHGIHESSVICYDSKILAVSVAVRCPSTVELELDGGWSLTAQLGCHLQLQRTSTLLALRCKAADWDMVIPPSS
jgi:hypothetical protein